MSNKLELETVGNEVQRLNIDLLFAQEALQTCRHSIRAREEELSCLSTKISFAASILQEKTELIAMKNLEIEDLINKHDALEKSEESSTNFMKEKHCENLLQAATGNLPSADAIAAKFQQGGSSHCDFDTIEELPSEGRHVWFPQNVSALLQKDSEIQELKRQIGVAEESITTKDRLLEAKNAAITEMIDSNTKKISMLESDLHYREEIYLKTKSELVCLQAASAKGLGTSEPKAEEIGGPAAGGELLSYRNLLKQKDLEIQDMIYRFIVIEEAMNAKDEQLKANATVISELEESHSKALKIKENKLHDLGVELETLLDLMRRKDDLLESTKISFKAIENCMLASLQERDANLVQKDSDCQELTKTISKLERLLEAKTEFLRQNEILVNEKDEALAAAALKQIELQGLLESSAQNLRLSELKSKAKDAQIEELRSLLNSAEASIRIAVDVSAVHDLKFRLDSAMLQLDEVMVVKERLEEALKATEERLAVKDATLEAVRSELREMKLSLSWAQEALLASEQTLQGRVGGKDGVVYLSSKLRLTKMSNLIASATTDSEPNSSNVPTNAQCSTSHESNDDTCKTEAMDVSSDATDIASSSFSCSSDESEQDQLFNMKLPALSRNKIESALRSQTVDMPEALRDKPESS